MWLLANSLLGILLRFCWSAEAVNLYVASYSGGSEAGNVTSLALQQKPDGHYSLSQTATLNTSTNSPSWLTLDRQNNLLYLVDEAVNGTADANGTVVVYKTSYAGELKEVSRTKALIGGVDATFFADGHALVVPHYNGSNIQTYKIKPDGGLAHLETIFFKSWKPAPGPIVERQESPHPHQAILDPTRSYILVPDLGDDEVHVFSINQSTYKLTPTTSLRTSLGVGPRHGVFSPDPIAGSHMFYLVGELSGNITAYRVGYKPHLSGMTFDEIASYGTLNPGVSFPLNPEGSSKVAPAEIDITVSHRHTSATLAQF
jgi:6-phosphogluconolactonase (cycloisomerase 2 family)